MHFWPGPTSDHHPPTYIFPIAGIAGIYHHDWFFYSGFMAHTLLVFLRVLFLDFIADLGSWVLVSMTCLGEEEFCTGGERREGERRTGQGQKDLVSQSFSFSMPTHYSLGYYVLSPNTYYMIL
jgi:hypothetical protein